MQKILNLIEIEREKRKKFLHDWGKILPVDFIPLLKN
jgi:hypothetical protein